MKMFTHTVESNTVEINAPIELVWKILVDLTQYPHWNPFTVKIEGELKVGNTLDLHVNMPKRGDRLQTYMFDKINSPHSLSCSITFQISHLPKALRKQKLQLLSIARRTYSTRAQNSGFNPPQVK